MVRDGRRVGTGSLLKFEGMNSTSTLLPTTNLPAKLQWRIGAAFESRPKVTRIHARRYGLLTKAGYPSSFSSLCWDRSLMYSFPVSNVGIDVKEALSVPIVDVVVHLRFNGIAADSTPLCCAYFFHSVQGGSRATLDSTLTSFSGSEATNENSWLEWLQGPDCRLYCPRHH